jgi:hypothetical protein
MTKKLIVTAEVHDKSTAPLRNVQKALRDTGKAAKHSGANFTEFNRVMFSTSAFVGMFTTAIRNVSAGMMEGARVDRVAEQFERVLGPRGRLFDAISDLTDNSIDKMEAMRAGISLRTLGIASSMEEVADIVAKSGTAAKMAGMESGEGIKAFSEFMKTGSVASLSFLNIIAETNPALQAQLSILSKAGGVMGKVISTQQKLAIGQSILNTLTYDQLKGQRDLLDVLADTGQAFKFLKASLGSFVGAALSPLIEKLTKGVNSFTSLLDRIKTGDKEFLALAKNVLTVTGTVSGLFGALGTLRLLMVGLSALGVGGLPFLGLSVIALASSFSDLDKSVERISKGFKLVGSAILGVFQLMSSFILNTDNAADGIGKMDAQLHKLLYDAGLLEYVKWIAKAGIVTVEFGKGVAEGMMQAGKWFRDTFGDAFDRIKDLLGLDFSPWSRNVIANSKAVGKQIGQLAAMGVALFGTFKLFKGMGGLLGKVPGVGKLFGGRDSGPSGTSGDPLYVKDVSGFKGAVTPGITGAVRGPLGVASSLLTNILRAGQGLAVLTIAAGAVKGIFDIITDHKDGFLNLASGVAELSSAVWSSVAKFSEGSTWMAIIIDSLKEAGKSVLNLPSEVFKTVSDTTDRVLSPWIGALSRSASFWGDKLKDMAGTMRGDLSPEMQAQLPVTGATVNNITNIEKELFQKKLQDPARLGVDANRGILINTPDMPNTQHERVEQIKKTIEMLRDDAAEKMTMALSKALEDQKITPEEWISIYKQGMDQSVVAENTKKPPQRPDHSAAMNRRGC